MKKVFILLAIFIMFSINYDIQAKTISANTIDYNCNEYLCIEEGEEYTFSINVDKSGEYYLGFDYVPSGNLVINDTINIKINGKDVEDESMWVLPSYYSYETDTFGVDRYGNEVLPAQNVNTELQSYYLKKSDGTDVNNISIYLNEGENKVKIKSVANEMKIKNLYVTDELASIKYEPTNNSGDTIIVEGEKFLQKNDLQINASSENTPAVTPSDPTYHKINAIDPETFKEGGQEIKYNVTVPKTGYYTLGLRGLNNNSSAPVMLNIYVNDKIQDEYFHNFPINSSKDYETNLTDKPIYLEEGNNTVTLEISIEEYASVLQSLNKVIDITQSLNNDLTQITGGIVDENRDWEMTKYMPNLEQDLNNILKELQKIKEDLLSMTNGEETEYTNTVDLMILNTQKLLENPNNVPNEMELLSSGTTSVLALGIQLKTDLSTHPYGIDRLFFIPYGQQLEEQSISMFDKIGYSWEVFTSSFSQVEVTDLDYDTEIDVWVKRPRQYVDIMQQMSDEQFTPVTGIKVNFSIMTDQNKITMANAANEQPDIVTGIDSWYAYELGIRGAFINVNDYEQTKDITSTMSYGGMITMCNGDEMYGIPETQEVYVMYMRDDLLNPLGYYGFNTWDDVLEALPILQANGMNFYLPFSGGTSLKAFTSTYPFFSQKNISLYTDDGMMATIDSEEAQNSLQFMTDLYTLYGLPENIPNFYDSFREGTIPAGISGFSTYIQLSYAAPELANKWSVSVVPGNVMEDGSINRSMTGGQTVASIFSKSEKKDESMEFLKWWMSTNTQIEFELRLISTYGSEYLWNSANSDAFLALPLPKEDLEAFEQSFPFIEEAPKTPGGYYLERAISDIWNSVVFEGENLKAVTDEQIDSTNKELQRKYIEFGYMDENGNVLKPYEIPTKESVEQVQTGV